jgi:hypothetical protein
MLTREILWRCFGQPTYSIYNETEGARKVHWTGHQVFEGEARDFVTRARASDQPVFIKTHNLFDPGARERVIYIARDGRAALYSFQRYLRDVNGLSRPLSYFVLGAPWPPENWSVHVAWGLARCDGYMLVLRYEDLRNPARDTLDKIARFIGLPVLAEFDVPFAELKASEPAIFGIGANDPGIEEVEGQCSALFWLVHGEMMQRLGYIEPLGRSHQADNSLVKQAVEELRRSLSSEVAMLCHHAAFERPDPAALIEVCRNCGTTRPIGNPA